jgi:hypothetical protein
MVAGAQQAPAAFDPFDADSSDLEEVESEPYRYRPQTTMRRRQMEGAMASPAGVGSPRGRRRRVIDHNFSSYLRSAQQPQQQRQQQRGRRRVLLLPPPPPLLRRAASRRVGGEV